MKKFLLVLLTVLCMFPVALMAQCGSSNLTATDADGNNYQSLKLGPHCWLLTNLRTNVPGSMIYYSDVYSDTAANLATYGRLYTWNAAVGDPMEVGEHNFVQGICPEGWHIPNEAEVLELTSNIAPDVHATTHWLVPGTNLTNYTQMPGGFYNASLQRCENLLGEAYFWSIGSAPGYEPVEVWSDCHCDMVMLNPGKVRNGLSVRCVYKIYKANVNTVEASNISMTSAQLNGNVLFAGYDENYERGFQWGSDRNNLTNLLPESTSASTEGLYNEILTDLIANTTYYYRAYVVNEFDTTFGVVRSFTTSGTPIMVVTTGNADNIMMESATLRGRVISMGENETVTVGFKYGTGEDALTTEAGTTTLSAAGNFEHNLTGLSDSTTYYYCVFETNSTDTVYGDTLNFTTLGEPAPVEPMSVTTDSATTITKESATLHGTVTSLGENENVTVGFKYGTSDDALTDEAGATTLSAAGTFEHNLTGLSDSTTYYYCAFETNSTDTVYGDTLNFTTLGEPAPIEPISVTADSADNITYNSADLHGTVTVMDNSNGLSASAGFVYGTTPNALNRAQSVNISQDGTYNVSIQRLTPNTLYYYRAFVVKDNDTVWSSNTKEFSTVVFRYFEPCVTDPTVTDDMGNVYPTVQIGTQCWMAQNMRTTQSISPDDYKCPNNDTLNVAKYGYLYAWEAATKNDTSSVTPPQGICPEGWQIPYVKDIDTLTTYLKRHSELLCNDDGNAIAKSLASQEGWMETQTPCAVGFKPQYQNDATGFNAYPDGGWNNLEEFSFFGKTSRFWLYNEKNVTVKKAFKLGYGEAVVSVPTLSSAYTFYFPVRCVRIQRAEEQPVPSAKMSVITREADSIELHSAIINGTIESMGVNIPIAAGFRYGLSENVMDAIVTVGDFMNLQDFSSEIANLAPSVTYYYQAFVTDGADTVWGEVMNFTTRLVCGIDSVADIDGNRYSTVKIGTQCWFQSNLRTRRYADGGTIGGNAKIYNVKDDESNDATYGLLYNWAAVMGTEASSNANPSGVQGICPDGWHVPSDAEWTQLTNYVNSKSLYLCSSENQNHIAGALASNKNGDWTYSVRECAVGNHPSNATGFSALPAGNYSSDGYASFGNNADFWSATQSSASNAHRRDLNYTWESVFDYTADKALGYSVRCLSNLVFPITMHVTTDNADDITNASATLHGVLQEMGEGHTSVKVGFKYGLSADDLDREIVTGTALRTPGTYSCKLTGLTNGTDYYYRAFVTANNDTAWGNIQKVNVHGFICGVEKLTDIDNNKYATVKMGNQCWMAENLRTRTDLSYNTPNKDDNNVGTYGLLYTWNTATKRQASDETHPMVQGICPKGWHIPRKDEWETMTKYVFDQPYYRCGSCSTWEENTGCIAKALASTTGWQTSAGNPCLPGSDTSTNNSTGFNAMPAGSCFYNFFTSHNTYSGFDSLAIFHTSTLVEYENIDDCEWTANIYGDSLNFKYRINVFKDDNYLSVRCVADSIYPLVMAVATDSSNKVSSSAVLLHGMAESIGDNDAVTVGFKYGKNENDLNQSVITTVIGVSSYACFIDVEDKDSIYYYKAFMTNGSDTVWGETLSFVNQKFTCGTDKIYDVEGNRYATVRIGHQCWMAENLRTTEGMEYDSDYFYPDRDEDNVDVYGLLYTFDAATQNDNINTQGICPKGWRIPSDDDWDIMTKYVFDQTQYRCGTCDQWEQETPCIAKALASQTGWRSSTNSCVPGGLGGSITKTGFNAMPAGYYQNWITSKYHYFGEYACFWTSTNDPTAAYYYQLSYDKDNIVRDLNRNTSFTLAASIRCVVDNMVVATDNPSNVLYHSATMNGSVKNLGSYPSVTVGFRYGTATDELNTVVENESPITAPSSYSHILNVLPETTYYYQAFESNGSDTVLGTIKSFTTPAAPAVTTDAADSITYHSATLNATINKMGGYAYVGTGFKYGTEPSNLTQKIINYVSSHEIGTFNCTPTDLISETTYYYQAFVVNETDTIFGGVESLTTTKIAEVVTDSTFQITNNSTSLYGTLKGLGGCSSVKVGFKYGTNADALDNVVTSGEMLTNVGTFSYKIGGLNDSTNYYYKAFVTHLSDTVYGQIKNFTTNFIFVTTDSSSKVTNSSASLCGSTGLGGNTLVIAGFMYGTDSASLSGMVSKRVTKEGYYNCDINGLLQNTTYYYKAFLIDGLNVILDKVKNFTTSGPVVVNTDSVTDITNCSAKMYGTIEELSGHSSLTAGFIFGTSQNALTETVETSADGAFSCEISAPIILNANTTYYYKAFASTDNETFYGEIKTFKTRSSMVATNNAKSIKNTKATLQAHIDDHDGTVTVGFRYGPKFLNMNTVVSVTQTQVAQDFSCIVEYLTPGETYYYKAFAASGRDTVWGGVKTFKTTDDCNDGLRYGSQCWAKSNVGGSQLYTWHEATGGINSNEVPSGVQGVCPIGWHLPSRAEWEIFMNYMYNEGRETFSATIRLTATTYETGLCPAKAMASKNWPEECSIETQVTARHPFAYTPIFEPDSSNNRSGFNARPYGIRNVGEAFVSEEGKKAYFWSSTNDNSLFFNLFGTDATSFDIIGFRSDPVLGGTNKNSAISVRCLRDYGTPTPSRSVTTNAASKIINQSATLNGRVNALGDLTNYVVAGFKYGIDQNQLNAIVKNHEPITKPGDFSCEIKNLSGSKYYYKAFAAVGTDTTWGETKYFDNIVPVTTDSVKNIMHFSAEVFCTAKNVQTDESVIMGIAYGTSDGAMTMQVVNSKKNTTVFSSDYSYSYKLTNLTPSTQYYYQAYVIKERDTVFATDVKTFKTRSAIVLAVSTDSCSNVTRSSGVLNGTLNRFDGSDSVKVGFKYCEVAFNSMDEYKNMNKLGLKTGQSTLIGDARQFSAPLASLKPNTYYYFTAFAVYQEDTVYGKIEKFKTTTIPCSGQLRPNEGGTTGAITSVTDIDNNVYGVVQIGSQCWMTENLKTTKYIDGTEISQNSDYNNNPKLAGLGLFYDWDVVANGRQTVETIAYGLCPQGWKVPTMEDWTALMDFHGVECISGTVLGTYCNIDPFIDNTTGFSFYNTGSYAVDSVYTYDEYFYSYGSTFRLATDYGNPKIASFLIVNQGIALSFYLELKNSTNIRCVRSESMEELTVVTNGATNNNTETSATCNYAISQNIGINVTERGICWNTSGSPSLNNSHTSEGAGTGTFTSSISGLNPGTTYSVRAYATDGNTVVYGNVVTFTTLKCGNGKIKDYEGNEYETVKIGSQCWMKSNLRTMHYANGNAISGAQATSYDFNYYYHVNGNAINDSKYGLLYNWKAVMDSSASSNTNPSGVQGICPSGWHVPSEAEWTQLTDFVSSQSSYYCSNNSSFIAKALAEATGWNNTPEICGVGHNPTNATGFSALPAGSFSSSGYSIIGVNADFWSSTAHSATEVYRLDLNHYWPEVFPGYIDKSAGCSVRCVLN